ncbi:LuxR C-terminal-related transcriptional regulator [Streptomyces sp. NPDC058619]|uniref:LuxR C-terminal-related transcriptional regulator n=1 Tax=unclassified Streptomyces TaxID=2593676 RepID=UPI0036661E3E
MTGKTTLSPALRIYGRSTALEAVAALSDRLRAGHGGALLLAAEPGLGRSALLARAARDFAAGPGPDLRATAAAADHRLPYGGSPVLVRARAGRVDAVLLHPLCAPGGVRPAGAGSGGGPGAGPADLPDPWDLPDPSELWGAPAADGPLLFCADDVHRWDAASRAALGAAVRRAGAARGIGFLLSATEHRADDPDFRGVPVVRLGPLEDGAATALLDALTGADTDPSVRDELLYEAEGNPALLTALVARLTPDQLRGHRPLPRPLADGAVLLGTVGDRLAALPADTRLLLLLAGAAQAAEPDAVGADAAQVLRAARAAGLEPAALDPAETSGVAHSDGDRITFAGPLLRRAAYDAEPSSRRRAAHALLAAAVDGDRYRLLHLLHRAAAADGHDPRLADALVAAAAPGTPTSGTERSAALARAAALTARGNARTTRLTEAAEYARLAGRSRRARELLAGTRDGTAHDAVRGRAELLRGTLALRDGPVGDAYEALLMAAARLGPYDRERALAARTEAMEAAWAAGDAAACLAALADAPGPGPDGPARAAPSPGAPALDGPALGGAACDGPDFGGLALGGAAFACTACGGPALGGAARGGPALGSPAPGGPACRDCASGSGAPAGAAPAAVAPAQTPDRRGRAGGSGAGVSSGAALGGAAYPAAGGVAGPPGERPVRRPPRSGPPARPARPEPPAPPARPARPEPPAPPAQSGPSEPSVPARAPAGPPDPMSDYRAGLRAALGGDLLAARVPLRRVLERARGDDDPARLLRAGVAALVLGDIGAACHANARALAVVRSRGLAALTPQVLEHLAYAELRAGRHARARAHAQEGLRAAHRAGQRNVAAHQHAILAMVASVEEDAAAVAVHAGAALAVARPHGLVQAATLAAWASARADLCRGRAGEAAARLGPLTRPGPHRGHFAVRMLAVPCFVEAAVLSGERAHARAGVDAFAVWAARGGDPLAPAQLARCRALLAAPEDADALYALALLHHEGADGDFERARTQLLYGKWLRRRRRPGEARSRLRDARIAFERCGAPAWAEQARAELRAAGEAPAPAPAGASPVARLTPQQLRIARCVAEGATNREVAARLSVSPRTVDHHLRNVFALLGVRSRTELARLVDRADKDGAHP